MNFSGFPHNYGVMENSTMQDIHCRAILNDTMQELYSIQNFEMIHNLRNDIKHKHCNILTTFGLVSTSPMVK